MMFALCWTCWWSEGQKCYNKTLGAGDNGIPLSVEHFELCVEKEGFLGKREALQTLIPGEKLIIFSEAREGLNHDREI